MSSWWKDLFSVLTEVDLGRDMWFDNNLWKLVGNDANTYFQTDPWLSDVPLYVRFHKLFELTGNPLMPSADMFGLAWEEGGNA